MNTPSSPAVTPASVVAYLRANFAYTEYADRCARDCLACAASRVIDYLESTSTHIPRVYADADPEPFDPLTGPMETSWNTSHS